LVFSNRTTEHKGIASCPECEYVDDGRPTPSARPARKPARKPAGEPAEKPASELEIGVGGATVRETNGRGGLRLSRKVWASVLLGVAAGLYVTRRSR
jgi:hypothetical protein